MAIEGNAALTYAWDFGDGNSSMGNPITHSYSSAGTYTASLTVSMLAHFGVGAARVEEPAVASQR